MDPATLATTATSLLLPYIAKGGKLALDKISEEMPETLGKLWGAISKRFADRPAAIEAAKDLAQKPDDTDNQEVFIVQLKKALKEDEEFAKLLTGLVEQAKSDSSIHIGGDGAVASDHSIAVNKFQADGNTGTISIGNRSGSS
jgi:hypothetical protein